MTVGTRWLAATHANSLAHPICTSRTAKMTTAMNSVHRYCSQLWARSPLETSRHSSPE